MAPAMPANAEMAFRRSDWSLTLPSKVPRAPPMFPMAASGPTLRVRSERGAKRDELENPCLNLFVRDSETFSNSPSPNTQRQHRNNKHQRRVCRVHMQIPDLPEETERLGEVWVETN